MEVWIASGKPMADRFEIVHAERAREAIAGGVTVLDVRGPNEYEAGMLRARFMCRWAL